MAPKKKPQPNKNNKPVRTNAGQNPMGSPKPATISQGLKIAGTGGITKQELKTIADTTGKSGGQVIQRLDKINQNLKAKDQTGINLNSGAANMLIKEAGPAYGGMYGLTQKPKFGTGKLGKTLEGMLGSRASGGYINPRSGKQFMTPAVERTLLPRGMDLMPSGRQTVRGIGKQFKGTTALADPLDDMMDDEENDQGLPTPPTVEPVEPTPPEKEEQQDVNINMPGSPFDLASWATGFKTARSSRKRAGRSAQGLASQRVAPTTNVLGM
jgi:hypothetical protein